MHTLLSKQYSALARLRKRDIGAELDRIGTALNDLAHERDAARTRIREAGEAKAFRSLLEGIGANSTVVCLPPPHRRRRRPS